MAFEYSGDGALDYFPCRYGKSKLLFRGPRRHLSEPYCAALGGGETYGKFVAAPWPVLLEARLNFPIVNFGYLNAGIDVFLGEPQLHEMTRMARVSEQAFGLGVQRVRVYGALHATTRKGTRQADIVERTHPREQVELLEYEADVVGTQPVASLGRRFGEVFVEELNAALFGAQNTAEQVQQCAFSTAARPLQEDSLPTSNGETGNVQARQGLSRPAKNQRFNVDGVVGHSR